MLTFKNTYFQLLLLLSLSLTACSVHITSPIIDNKKGQISPKWYSHQQSVMKLTHYQIHGTFFYISNKQKVYARFNWQQINAEHYRVILMNPFGNTEMDLTIQPGVKQCVNYHGKCYVTNNPEVFFQKLIGINIPLNSLQQWMIGLPGKATDFQLDSYGHLKQVNYTQNRQTWTVSYHGYNDKISPQLPSSLEIKHDNNSIKFKIDSWSL